MKKVFFFLLALPCLLGKAQPNQNFTQTLRGKIVDKSLQTALPGAVVVLFSQPMRQTSCNEDGKFSFTNVPVGKYRVLIRMMGYKEIQIPQIEVSTGKETVLTLPMEEDIRQAAEIVVEAGKDKSRVGNELAVASAQNMRPAEINRFAGSRSDPSRMAANYAGVAGGGDLRNDIIVRGNSPWGVLWRLEGVDIPNPNHFSFTGNTGGAFSILNNNLLAGSDFLTGAFPAEYGNKTAAVFDVRLREGNNEKRENTAQIGLNGLEFATEGPISTSGKGSYLASARVFSFKALDALGVSIGADGIPQYQDGTFKIHIPGKKGKAFTAWGLAGRSSIFMQTEGEDLEEDFIQKRSQTFASGMFAGGMNYVHNLGPKTRGLAQVSASGSAATVDNLEQWDNRPNLKAYDLNNQEGQVLGQYVLTHKWNVRNMLRTGITARSLIFNNRESYFDRNKDQMVSGLSQKGNAGLVQLYAQYQYRFSERLTLNPGLYFQRFGWNGSVSLEPRFSAVYQANDLNRFSFATGLHSQMAPLFVYQYQFKDSPDAAYRMPNRDLGFSKSYQAVLGYQRQIGRHMQVKMETYVQYLFQVPVSFSSDTGAQIYSILNTGADYGFYVPDSLRNSGKGLNYGIEMTLERYYHKGLYLLGTVSLFKSTYEAADGIRRSTLFDIGHVVNLLAGKEFGLDKENHRLFSIDMRLTHTGGRPYIPVDEANSIRDGKARYSYQQAYEPRLKGYFRTDLKLAYHINRPKASHNIFLAADNVFNTQNMFWRDWNNRKQKVETYYQMGLFPYLGYRVQF